MPSQTVRTEHASETTLKFQNQAAQEVASRALAAVKVERCAKQPHTAGLDLGHEPLHELASTACAMVPRAVQQRAEQLVNWQQPLISDARQEPDSSKL